MSEVRGVHPQADAYPLFTDEALALLTEDIAENGQRDPITLTPDGLILDGRNRFAACERAGVQPRFRGHRGRPRHRGALAQRDAPSPDHRPARILLWQVARAGRSA